MGRRPERRTCSRLQGSNDDAVEPWQPGSGTDQFPSYHAIDVFADDLGELRAWPLPANLRPLDGQGRTFLVTHEGKNLKLEIFPEQGVARLSRNGLLATITSVVGSTIAGSLVGAAIAAAGQQKGAGLLGGQLLGLLVGASLGGAAGDARRVFALTYDHVSGQWQPYDGGLL